MAVGIEIYNDARVPQLITETSFNMVARSSGTISVGSNTAATGASGFFSLPSLGKPYIVFIRSTGNAAAYGRGNGFAWFMGQGTTSFDYWAYGPSTDSGSGGVQVFNPDGSVQWDMTQRPLRIAGKVNQTGSPPYSGEMSTSNILTGPTYYVPANMAFCLSDMGWFIDVYSYPSSGVTMRGNMRYYPTINIPSATQLRINYCRMYPNRGTLGSGVNYSTFATKNPSFILYAPTF